MDQTFIVEAERPRRKRRGILFGLAAASLLATSSLVGATSLALFTDQAIVDQNGFTTGTIDIATDKTSSLISFTNMLPGDSVTEELLVTNSGSGEFRYAMTSTATDADGKGLADQLRLIVKAGGTVAAFDGVTIYDGPLAGASFGDVAQGAQGGDRVLPSGGVENLVFRASLPIETGNAYQAAATTATFVFDAEQTSNNP